MVASEVGKYEVILEMVAFDCMVIMHNAIIDSHPTDNLSNIKCCVPFLSNRDEILCSLDVVRQYLDN
jgi:hypothetical protein